MKIYENPIILSKPFVLINAAGQYIFGITANGCPGLNSEGAVSDENGLAFCTIGEPTSPGFTATITCQNISGTFSAVYGDAVSGGGLSCSGLEQSSIYPLLSISPDLSGDCIVESFTLNGSNQC